MSEQRLSGTSSPRRYRFGDRWRIAGTLTTGAPMHIGSGDTTIRYGLLNEKTGKPCEVQAVTLDWRDRACIPGSAIKGILRSWAEKCVVAPGASVDRIFGDPKVEWEMAESGRAEFLTAFIDPRFSFPSVEHIPYWDPVRLTGVASHVCINRTTGAAEAEKLFFEEYVPAGARFTVEILASGLAEDDIRFLLAVMKQGAAHRTHPYQLGANGADGWGRVEWDVVEVTRVKKSAISLQSLASLSSLGKLERVQQLAPLSLTEHPIAYIAIELMLNFQGPFLVNDASKTKPKDAEEGDERPNFAPLRHPDGTVWLPASSFRGALRQRTEFLLRSLNEGATGDRSAPAGNDSIERIFGQTSHASRLTIGEFVQFGPCSTRRQDFVAIDRFTGGAADGAKFDAKYADHPTLKTTLVLDASEIRRQDVALLAQSLRDVCEGRVSFGFGAGKGYGYARGELSSFAFSGLPADWGVPASVATGKLDAALVDWLNASLGLLPEPAMAQASSPTGTGGPESVHAGRLAIVKTKDGKVEYTLTYKHKTKNKDSVLKLPPERIAPSLRDQLTPGVDVDFTFEGSSPVQVRRTGEKWSTGSESDTANSRVRAGHFIHPYYFLALADRSNFQKGALADGRPLGHERLLPGTYTGTIRIRLTMKTPLLVCDDESVSENENGHKTYSMRTDNGRPDGRPLVMSSSVRGMLRSAYEAITNSRFGVFPGRPVGNGKPAVQHGRRSGFRLPANTGLDTVPVRIVDHNGKLAAELMAGSSTILNNGKLTPGDPVFAAWCGSYGWTPRGRSGFSHRAIVWAYLTPWHYQRVLPRGKVIDFDFWNVEEVRAGNLPMPTAPPTASGLRKAFGRSSPSPSLWAAPGWYQGRLCVTGRNMGNKHDERFFFSCSSPPLFAAMENDTIEQWRQLIQDYQDQHERELENGVTRPQSLPQACTFSRHITHGGRKTATIEQELKVDDLCYAEVTKVGDNWKVRALYPIMISRKLYDKSPLALLPEGLRPATTIETLSPADRVFGWVSQDALPGALEPAYRGHVRVGVVTCETPNAIERFPQPKTLGILGQPKPAQGRFYLGQANGSAQNNGLSKERAGYGGTNRIRGPKVFPHHREFSEASWIASEGSNQNRSITGWVTPGTSFELDLHVENLPRVELGALVWLLSLPPEHFLRMGLGKPLGFGSVRAEIIAEKTRIADGAAWTARIRTWDGPLPDPCDLEPMKAEFVSAIKVANPSLLPSFERAARGFAGMPVHYPRLSSQRSDDGEHYEWFVQNEKQQQLPLPDLSADPSLPLLSPP